MEALETPTGVFDLSGPTLFDLSGPTLYKLLSNDYGAASNTSSAPGAAQAGHGR